MTKDKLPPWLSRWFEPERRIWPVFIVVFLVSQAVNIWALLPDYSGWDAFGFPFSYLKYQNGADYSYFDAVILLADLVIMFIVARLLVYGYNHFTRYKFVK
jgi:uncharacterized membrane protein